VPEQALLQTFAQHCMTGTYDDVQVNHDRTTACRSVPRGFQIVELKLGWKRRSWRLGLSVRTAFFLPGKIPDEGNARGFWTTPAMLDAQWPSEWQYIPGALREPVEQALVEAYERTVVPHLEALSSPAGLLQFMQERYRRGMFLEPRPRWSVDGALLLVPYLEPEQQVSVREALLIRAQQSEMC